jgi:mannose/fructose/sorbose-specific phosphotransferase system IIA component
MGKKSHKEPLIGVVVVTHGDAAVAMLSAAREILGRVPAVCAVSAAVGEPMAPLVEKISAACEQVDQGGGVLLLVDVHGSTPFHAAMSMLDGTRPAEVLCGVNLPMLIKLANIDRTQGPPVVLAEELRDSGRRSIRLGSELTGKVVAEERR